MNIVAEYEKSEVARLKRDDPEFGVGDTLAVSVNITEGKKSRIQIFEGVVIAMRNRGLNSAFTVRKISAGEGLERTFQLYSPVIQKINVLRRGDVKRAKLYYLRERSGRSARIKEKLSKRQEQKSS